MVTSKLALTCFKLLASLHSCHVKFIASLLQIKIAIWGITPPAVFARSCVVRFSLVPFDGLMYCFSNMIRTYNDVARWITDWFCLQRSKFLLGAIHALPDRRRKFVASSDRYFEKSTAIASLPFPCFLPIQLPHF
ncbi:hypothetical protein AVEN_226834-1 [Araneus ventricosus]|uniref:Uncharacterized protein n=1 Tax=Araneus ventricosus TaxID=182803 RepID=A0A4Y2JQ34_ARAVE|nr:hypothetical protein AVEN_226834-1 [Araneus ventricosus]